MADRPAALFSRLLLSALLFLPFTTRAEAGVWYRVELIVFSNSSGDTAEQWAATPNLDYPGASRFLIDPARVKGNKRQYTGDSSIDKFGRQIISRNPHRNRRQAQDIPIRAPVQGAVTEGGRASTSGSSTRGSAAVNSTPPPAPLPTPFITLPGAQMEFRGKAAYMQKTGRYRILFHQAWVQPIASKSRELPIVVDRSGDEGTWPVLQGTIKLYQSRYLYLETNLWMNTDGEYLHSQWSMPPPPLGPLSLIVEEPIEHQPAPIAAMPADELLSQPQSLEEGSGEEELGPVYPFRHAVLLQQTRRMRSGEVHYIDHPMMGVIIKVTPVSQELLQALPRAATL